MDHLPPIGCFFQKKHTNERLGPPSEPNVPSHIQIGDPAANSRSTKSRARSISRVSWASFLFSAASVAFYKLSRSPQLLARSRSCSATPAGAITSEWMTQLLLE